MTAPSASSRHASASETTQAYLAVNNMHAHYGESYIVQGITLAVNEGEILALLGRNGAGKTTTLRTIARLNDPQLTNGELWLDGSTMMVVIPSCLIRRRVFSISSTITGASPS